ncbi:MAG: hypothetical protein ABIT07_12700 [Ferruginibacter sp.]
MKKMTFKPFKAISFFFLSMLMSLLSIAQDKKVDINLNTKSGNDNMFAQPWVWVVGGAVFILLLIALLRNNKR